MPVWVVVVRLTANLLACGFHAYEVLQKYWGFHWKEMTFLLKEHS